MKTSILFLLGMTLSAGNATSLLAADPIEPRPCVGSDPKQSEILSHFTFKSNDPNFRPDFCDNKNLGYKVARALLFLESTGNSGPTSPDKFDHGVLGANPFQFFSSRIQTLLFESKEGRCSSGVTLAYVEVHQRPDGIMHICPALADQDEFYVSSTLIHEARHQEGYLHVACKQGLFKELGDEHQACDPSYETAGSYGVQTEYLVKVSRSKKIESSIKQNARALAIQAFIERFNSMPLGIQEGAALLSNESKVLFYNGESAIAVRSLPHSNNRLIEYQSTLSFFDPDNTDLTTLPDGVSAGQSGQYVPSQLTDTRQLLDRYESLFYNCRLYTNEVDCFFPDKRITLPIREFSPVGFWNYAPLSPSDKTIYIVAKNQKLYSVSPDSNTLTSKQSTSAVNAADWNDLYYIFLGFNGKVSLASKDPRSNNPFKPALGLSPDDSFTKMIAPFYWSKQLQEL